MQLQVVKNLILCNAAIELYVNQQNCRQLYHRLATQLAYPAIKLKSTHDGVGQIYYRQSTFYVIPRLIHCFDVF
jgi:hypothetical protein